MTLMGVYTETVAPPKVPTMPEVIPRKVRVVTARETGEKVKIVVLKSEDFGGEHKKNGFLYLLVLWLVSIWAMITNSFQILFVKVSQARKSTLRDITWKIGRNPNHISSFFVDRFSRFNHESKFGAAGWLSLDIFYNYWGKVRPQLKRDFEGFITRFWIERMANRQAVTNRFKIVTNLLAEAFEELSKEPEIRLVSVASGSAQAVIAAMSRCPHLNIKAILIDPDREALAQAEKDAQKAGLLSRFTFVRGTRKRLASICSEFSPHIIEMVGFLDYLGEEKAVELISRIKDCLPGGGIFLTCNIRNNPERIFLHWVLLWPMVYRSEREFISLFLKAGFSPGQIRVFYEPFRIHGIGICKK
ncbi:MAG: class I SAM-dependent methyltransferase family protein [Patescibacteria group bacterium]|nr:class I SAM-dependent methyltransferase family protein [Patescibacteria group bacterium]